MAINNAVNANLSGNTGTGNFVGATSPTLVTPALGVATGTSLNIGASTTINGVINDSTMATASATTGATSSSIKSYIDTAVRYDFLGNFGGTSLTALPFTGLSTSAYQVYVVEVQFFTPVTGSAVFQLRTSTNNGVSYDSAAGNYAWSGSSSTASAVSAIGSTSATSLGLTANTVGTGASFWLSGRIFVLPNNSANAFTRVISELLYSNTTGVTNVTLANASGWRADTVAINAFELFFSTGNISAGFAKLYGIA